MILNFNFEATVFNSFIGSPKLTSTVPVCNVCVTSKFQETENVGTGTEKLTTATKDHF